MSSPEGSDRGERERERSPERDSGEDDRPQKRRVDSDDEGEEVSRPSRKKPGLYSDEEDEEDEDLDEHVTEEDKRFVVGDDEVEESDASDGGRGRRDGGSRKRGRDRDSDENEDDEDDVDEEDLELIAANTGQKRRIKRHRASSRSPSPDRGRDDDNLNEAIFRDGDADERESLSERDEMDDFIVDDEQQSGDEQELMERRRRMRRQESQKMRDNAAMSGVDEETYRFLVEVFGDDTYFEHIQKLKKKAAAGKPAGDDDYLEEDEELRPAVQSLKLTDIYEPTVLVEKMLTEKDELIRKTDIPERFQLLQMDQNQAYMPAKSEEDLEDEAIALARQWRQEMNPGMGAIEADSRMVEVIRRLLWFMRGEENHFMEVPFLAAHRKDYWVSYLGQDPEALWRVFDMDLAYQARSARLKELETLVNRVREAAAGRAAVDHVIDSFSEFIDTVEGVQDVRKYIFLHYGRELRKLDELEGRPAAKTHPTSYELAQNQGIGEVTQHYHIDVDSFVRSCDMDRKYCFPEDDAVEPLEAMARHTNAKYKRPELLLAVANKHLAEEIAAHPRFRAIVRRKFEESAVINVAATAKGRDIIGDDHEYASFKYINEKPVAAFRSGNVGYNTKGDRNEALKGQFALISRAAAEGLVTIEVDISDRAQWVNTLERFIESENTSDVAKIWNRQRKEVLQLALHAVSADASKWLKNKLLTEATETICRECQTQLAVKLTAAPFMRKKKEKTTSRGRASDTESDDDEEEEDRSRRDCRVAAVSWGDGGRNATTFAVTLDEDGLVANFIQLARMQDRGRDQSVAQSAAFLDRPGFPPEPAKAPKQADLERLAEFLVSSRPDVVVMAASTVGAMRLFQDVQDQVDKVRKSHTFLQHLEIHWVTDDTAQIWKNSAEAKAEFREYNETLRYCIGLARKAQDPVMAYASLFNQNQDITKVKLYERQSSAPADLLVRNLERAIINAVGRVGVDINAAIKHRHRAHTLQYVSGLGPRKAGAILAKLARIVEEKQLPGLESRQDLVTEKVVGPNVFFNCNSFIRIRKYHFGRRNAHIDVLDDTRIHVKDYALARQMAADAVDADDLAEDDEQPSQYVEELMASKDITSKLNELDLDGYADELEKRNNELKKQTLVDIKAELQSPYGDSRTLTQLYPNISELFFMLTKEPVSKFFPNCPLLATVRKKLEKRIYVELPGGVEGVIEVFDPADENLKDVQEGHTARVVVRDILALDWKKEGFDVSVMTEAPKFEVNVDTLARWQQDAAARRDEFFNPYREKEEAKKREDEQRRRVASQAMENVNHPLYRKDLTADLSQKELAGKAVGEMLLRPSAKIGDLVVVMKTDENIFWHIPISKVVQGGVPKWQIRDMKSASPFEDLDHLLTVYVDPIREKAKEMNRHPKYRQGKTLPETEQWVRQVVLNNPRQAAYALCPAGQDGPNCYYLVYQFPGATGSSHERIFLAPGYFSFRKERYKTVDELILHFKRNPHPPPQQVPGHATGYATARPAVRPGGQSYYAPAPSTYGGPMMPIGMTPYGAGMSAMRPQQAQAGGASYYGGVR
ncbi:hypothetical protein DFJ74DRAFT_671098 [Hyaloraphidium curvatum]|nr:hypothetical protein DFJ74DRAFT_671098 [Hyaloraphidium curvatum]